MDVHTPTPVKEWSLSLEKNIVNVSITFLLFSQHNFTLYCRLCKHVLNSLSSRHSDFVFPLFHDSIASSSFKIVTRCKLLVRNRVCTIEALKSFGKEFLHHRLIELFLWQCGCQLLVWITACKPRVRHAWLGYPHMAAEKGLQTHLQMSREWHCSSKKGARGWKALELPGVIHSWSLKLLALFLPCEQAKCTHKENSSI